MKVIQSAGGPLIGLDTGQIPNWSGALGKKFLGADPRFKTDYEAVKYFANGRHKPPCAVSLLGDNNSGEILIAMPFETAIVDQCAESIYIAQVEYADYDWDFKSLSHHDFEIAAFGEQDKILFSCKSSTYVLFDSAYSGHNVGEDFLTFNLSAGDHVLAAAEYKPDEKTGLVLYKIQKA